MSTTALSQTQEIIERSLFERIRIECVDKGYTPNIAATTGDPPVLVYPNSVVGKTAFDAALASIASGSKGFAIDIFNNANNKNLGTKKIPRIVLNSDSFLQGQLGGDSTRVFRSVGETFSAYRTPPQTVNYYFNVRIVSNDVKQERILTSIMSLALPKRGYVPIYNAPSFNFFCRNINSFDLSDEGSDIIEKQFSFEVQDAWDMEDELLEENIAKLIRIELHPNVQAYRDRVFGYNSDIMVVE